MTNDKAYRARIRVAFDVSNLVIRGSDEALAKESLLRWTDNEVISAISDAIATDNWGNLDDPKVLKIEKVE